MTHSGDLAHLIVEFDDEAALALVKHELTAGTDPMALVAECSRGMQMVGQRYEEGTYYISGLIMAGDLLRKILAVLAPHISSTSPEKPSGTMLICTVRGDIHDIGKGIAANLLTAHGFRVVDLGVDVSPSRVADEVAVLRPDIVGLSALTAVFAAMKLTVEAVRDQTASWSRHVPVILGGGSINQEVCEYAGADGWCSDAVDGVALVRKLLQHDLGMSH